MFANRFVPNKISNVWSNVSKLANKIEYTFGSFSFTFPHNKNLKRKRLHYIMPEETYINCILQLGYVFSICSFHAVPSSSLELRYIIATLFACWSASIVGVISLLLFRLSVLIILKFARLP